MARDTPGRDAYQAAARKARKGSLRDFQLPKQSGSNWLSDAAKAIGVHPKQQIPAARQMASDAYWSITHPLDRLTGKGRATNGQMQWVGPNKLFPSARMPTPHPDWEIVRNRERDTVVGLTGRLSHQRLPRNDPVVAARYNVDIARRIGASQRQLQTYEMALRNAIQDKAFSPLDLAFSAVPRGTRQAQATIGMRVDPQVNYVDWIAKLADPETLAREQRAFARFRDLPDYLDYEPQMVPPNVMMQLMALALGPEKPIRASFANRELGDKLLRLARRRGIDLQGDMTGF